MRQNLQTKQQQQQQNPENKQNNKQNTSQSLHEHAGDDDKKASDQH